MYMFIDHDIIGFFEIFILQQFTPAQMSGRNLVLIRIPKVWRIINRYGGSRSLFPLYKHYKKLIEILLQCHQYFLPFFQVIIILDIMMSCDFKNFHILTFVNFVLPAA